ncbi:MAG TPA: zinc ribbon domain-containing protein, partial [Acidimicrobiales bacterium]
TGHLIGIPHGQWFLSKLLTCGRCGHNLFKARSNGKPCWCCPKPEFGGCGRITVQAHQVEPLVLRTLFAYVDGLELADLVAEGDSDLRADIMTRLAEMDLKATEYRDMLHCGELDRRGYGQLVDRVNSDRADLTDRLGELSSHSVLSDYAGQPGTLEDEWSQPEMTVDRQRAIINAALAPIVVVASRTRGPKWDTERVRFGAKQQAAEAFLRHQERIA